MREEKKESCVSVEIDMNEEFKFIPEEEKKRIRENLERYLIRFRNIVLSAIYYDFSLNLQWSETKPGAQLIITGLREMAKQLDILTNPSGEPTVIIEHPRGGPGA